MSDRARGQTYEVGDRVRIDIPDETHPDHRQHGENGQIIAILSAVDRTNTGASQAGRYRVELDSGGAVDVHAKHLRPPI